MSIEIEIDGVPARVSSGTIVLEAARDLGDYIPTLCLDERLEPVGACRACRVGVAGAFGQARLR
jgi:NADH dehydrogenase/NADH:ubiquinone oxidoreductase subunit G